MHEHQSAPNNQENDLKSLFSEQGSCYDFIERDLVERQVLGRGQK